MTKTSERGEKFKALAKSLKDKLDEQQNLDENHLGALEAHIDDINKDNFELDPKNDQKR